MNYDLVLEWDDEDIGVIIDHINPGAPMVVTGWGFGDAEPPEPPEVDYRAFRNGERFEPNEHEAAYIEQKIWDSYESREDF